MLLIALALFAAEPPSPPPRPMQVEIERDTISDEIRATATQFDRGQRLVVACNPGEYDGIKVTFHATRWLARGNFFSGERPLIYRFDDQPPVRLIWNVGDRSGHIDARYRVHPFLRGLIRAQQLLIRTRDIEDRAFDVVIRIVEGRQAIRRLLDACGESRMRRRLFGEG